MQSLENLTPDMPVLETPRLIIRPFRPADLEDAVDLMDVQLENRWPADQRERYLRWNGLNEEMHARLYQPPFDDRAIILKSGGALIGVCGLVATLVPMGLLTSCEALGETPATALTTIETGMYYALHPRSQGQGYATEAAAALIQFGFEQLRLVRMIATTSFENVPSQRVMKRVGMRIERNRFPEPFWFNIAGIIENPQR